MDDHCLHIKKGPVIFHEWKKVQHRLLTCAGRLLTYAMKVGGVAISETSQGKAVRPVRFPLPSNLGILALMAHHNHGYAHIITNTCYDFLIIFILVGMKWYFIVFLIYIFLTTDDIKHCFMCLLAVCISSLKKCPCPFFKLHCLFIIEL